MQAEMQISLDSNTHLPPETISIQNGDRVVFSSSANTPIPQQPAQKRPTRQWAAWTRQEEESFFSALRQVGKNFEKITCRVQSKNKDQVRHYYYRLVRRMNKLLGPELSLDAKNSKDTNAAMLRWWSLLEKYSCKASKLHLKPRRFKIFVETLEHQLLRDRKKNVRKRPLQGENCPSAALNTVSNQSRASGNDARTVKLVLVESQNIQKLGPLKASLKRNVNLGVNRGNCKGDLTIMKPSKQRKKSGMIRAAAYKKWEKAAIAGVSLVADAAEHLERAATVKEIEHDQEIPGENCSDPVGNSLPSMPTFPHNHFVDNNIQNTTKLKLQLFPIDDRTRRALEMDNYNPYLELTLSTRKKISSILEHLNCKWGGSSIAIGELVLFPYSIQRENLVGYQRWTQESILSAADVYAMSGSPSVFCLRYGWFSKAELGSSNTQVPIASSCVLGQSNFSKGNKKGQIVDSAPLSLLSTNNFSMDPCEYQVTSMTRNSGLNSTTDLPNTRNDGIPPHLRTEEPSDPNPNVSQHRKDGGDGSMTRQMEDMEELQLSNGMGLSAGEWADSLTNISMGDLLSGVSQDLDDNCINPPITENCHGLQQIPFSSDSFDAAIAAHISRHQDNKGHQPTLASHTSSIWDAEETCDAFLFKKDSVTHEDGPCLSPVTTTESYKQVPGASPECSEKLVEQQLPEEERIVDDFTQTDPMDDCESDADIQDHSAKDFSGLADMYWPDSLGPLDLEIPSTKYHSEDLILSDSLSGLNRLIASSLDAFQNCVFFGLDKNKASSTVEARETASFTDFQIGSGV